MIFQKDLFSSLFVMHFGDAFRVCGSHRVSHCQALGCQSLGALCIIQLRKINFRLSLHFKVSFFCKTQQKAFQALSGARIFDAY